MCKSSRKTYHDPALRSPCCINCHQVLIFTLSKLCLLRINSPHHHHFMSHYPGDPLWFWTKHKWENKALQNTIEQKNPKFALYIKVRLNVKDNTILLSRSIKKCNPYIILAYLQPNISIMGLAFIWCNQISQLCVSSSLEDFACFIVIS